MSGSLGSLIISSGHIMLRSIRSFFATQEQMQQFVDSKLAIDFVHVECGLEYVKNYRDDLLLREHGVSTISLSLPRIDNEDFEGFFAPGRFLPPQSKSTTRQ